MVKMLDPIAHARNEALEEAAKVAEETLPRNVVVDHMTAGEIISVAIRALKTPTED